MSTIVGYPGILILCLAYHGGNNSSFFVVNSILALIGTTNLTGIPALGSSR